MSTFILVAGGGPVRYRTMIDTEEPGDDRLQKLSEFLEFAGVRQLSTSHQCHAVAGPDNPHFEIAVEAYGIDWFPPCDANIVTAAMEMLVASELLEPTMIDSPCLRGLISMGFVSEDDWDERGRAVDIITRSYLAEHFDGFDLDPENMDAGHLAAYAGLSGGLMVAMAKARADWTVG